MSRAVPTPIARVAPPLVSPASLSRPALEARLDDVFGRRLAAVVAGPGYGKSTLLAQWTAETECAWYTVSRQDASLTALALGIAGAIRRVLPALPVDVSALPAAGSHGDADAVAAHLSGALGACLSHDLVLVLDDVHELASGPASVRLIESLCRHAPRPLRLVVASRTDLPFPIARLRGRGEVVDVDAQQLAFSREEVAALVRAALGEADTSLADELHVLTGGWPAAVRLAIEALRPGHPGERVPLGRRLQRPQGPLYSYLAEEVLAPEPPAVRELVRLTAPLERFTPELCAAVGVDDAAATLANLLRRGLFVAADGAADGWFTLHGLVRDFALDAWPLADAELRELHRRAAAWLDEQGYVDDALRSLVRVQDGEALAACLAGRGAQLVAAGSVEDVLASVCALPEALRTPEIEEIAGQAWQVQGRWDDALACFERAGGSAERLRPAIAWRIGLIHYLRGELDESLATYARAELDRGETREEALLHAWWATANWVKGRADECRLLAQRALELASAAQDDQALGAAHTVLAMLASLEGDRARTYHHDAEALAHAQRAGDILQIIRIRANSGSHLADEGEYALALSELDEAIRLAELAGFANFHALSLSNRGETRLRLGRLDDALADLQAAKTIYQRLRSRALCYPLGHLGEVYRERGELVLARATYEEAIAVAEASGDAQGLVPALAGLARVLAAADPDAAERTAARALSSGTAFGSVQALLAAGWIALGRDDRARASAIARDAVAAAGERRDRAALAEAIELGVLAADEPEHESGRLEEANRIWRELGSTVGEARSRLALALLARDDAAAAAAERALRELGVRTRPPLAAGLLASLPGAEPAAVTIRLLGSFAVERAGALVTPGDWQSKKARDLLKLLVARRGRATPREALMEELWPNEEPARLANRLSVALSVLRSVLDPERRFPQEHFVRADKESAALMLGNLDVDVESFLAAANTGLALRRAGRGGEARDRLAAAEAAYPGDFLEEDAYADWAVPLREEARAAYVEVAWALAVDAGDADASVRYCMRVLEREPYDERAHLGLVSALERAGRHGESRRAYSAYAARMNEIGIEASPFPSPAETTP